MKVALIHYWLVGMRGGEKVLEALCRIFPDADIFTHVCDPKALSPTLRRHRIIETSVGRMPMARRLYQSYLPFMPGALERLDLSGYDLVISSESGPAKGVIAPVNAPHICYCHTPMRYLWDQYHMYRSGAGTAAKMAMPVFAPSLRKWDVTSAARVDTVLANSTHVAKRVQKYWRRDATVLAPPVDVDAFEITTRPLGDYYLWVGELAPYKRPDLAVEAFTRMRKKLVVIGGPGKTARDLKRRAGNTIHFLGKTDFATLQDHMARCKALIFPGEEDFGIVPVEAMASGRPVIALGRGGATDTIVDRKTGVLYDDQSAEGLIDAVERFEADKLDQLDPVGLRSHAAQFGEPAFRAGMIAVLRENGIHLPQSSFAVAAE